MKRNLIIAAAAIVGLIIGLSAQPLASGDDLFTQIRKFNFVLNTASRNYVEEVDNEKLVEASIKALLDELDPHSVYIPPKENKKVQEDFRGDFEGIGIQFSVIEDTITVISALSGGPSKELGIMSGDKIVKIDGEKAVGLDQNEVPKLLKGPKGTKVTVDIFRSGEPELLFFEITRDKIPLYSVDASFIIDGTDVGYVSINRFMAKTYNEMIDSLKTLRGKGMKKLLLDLRGNPGGYLQQAFFVADEFTKGGDMIVYTKGRDENQIHKYIAEPGGVFEDIPIIVLIDAGSASASEIVSGAIQDLDRGLIVGVTSFGKGLVQQQYEIGDGSAFRITTAKYYTPSGRCIQRPYDDPEKYRSFEGRLKLEEGANLEHALEQVKAHFPEDSVPPIYKTANGRPVLGGGGVTPDYIVKYDTIAPMSRKILSKNLFFIYSRAYLEGEGENVEAKYKSDFKKYLRSYEVDEDMIAGFRKVIEDHGVEWKDDDYKKDEFYLKTMIKSTIARNIWDNNERTACFLPYYRQIEKAIELFPQAEKMARSN